jgi:hypothetical protein
MVDQCFDPTNSICLQSSSCMRIVSGEGVVICAVSGPILEIVGREKRIELEFINVIRCGE